MPRTPDYQRIAEDIRGQIAAGTLKPGDRLPTQDLIAAQYGTSVQPVKTAMLVLEAEGLVDRRRGGSAVVANRPK